MNKVRFLALLERIFVIFLIVFILDLLSGFLITPVISVNTTPTAVGFAILVIIISIVETVFYIYGLYLLHRRIVVLRTDIQRDSKKKRTTRKPKKNSSTRAINVPDGVKYCPYCGAPLLEGAKFCANCGAKLR